MSKPFQPPQAQNFIVIEAFLEAAKRFARGGFDVIIDGIIGQSIEQSVSTIKAVIEQKTSILTI